ncbi:glycoside hydrolase family 99-like domain-containing protein [Pseudoxanthomonas sp.]|uniref:glycoside hydrolase family 99-like domain-containing protein n=1 Tax=Pseudoxanthomonas sp. TaxID=1871049 RepID=UPI00258EE6A9|nr:glycoside hydrolase family 99-like domain-containing protein [Pseudoxanthomonas sp.]MCR6686489.1 glycoside hydrolase family 99-like domain-containing protein [Pseudoxanthomonas sp.]
MSRTLRERLKHAAFGLLRTGFRLLPLGPGARDRWRQRFLGRFPGLVPEGPRGQACASGSARRARVRSDLPALGHVPYRRQPLPDPLPAKLVAFYLPQFHAIPENDAWWGKGFTEWRNVGRALPQFEGHAQPRLPADLGFYDLRNPQVMRDQARLAGEYGIGAFCFYFYWFGGKTLLEAPLEQWLADASIELPFCLCWANENWSRRWDGREQDVLIAQRHSAGDDLAFIAHAARYLRDPRYLRVDGKPLLLVYRPGLLPDAKATAARWRQWCLDNGIGEIVLAYVQGFERPDPGQIGFDAAVEFPPNLSSPGSITAHQRLLDDGYRGQVLDWRELAADYLHRPLPGHRLFPGVNCGWDNEPRRPGRGRTYLHASPRRYRDWLRGTVHTRLAQVPASDRLVFINAWNEWAEGAVLEPDTRLGHAWLQATRDALAPASPVSGRPACLVHAWDLDALDEILLAILASGVEFDLWITTTDELRPRVQATLAAHGLQARILAGPNHGRDILPFLRAAGELLDAGTGIVLKLHTKKSHHRDDGDRWRRELLERLLAPARAPRILEAMRERPQLGLVVPEGHLLGLDAHMGGNRAGVDYLSRRLGLREADADARFVSGSMFWARLEALRPLLDAHLDEWEFEPEQGQIDGTLAHAVERVFALCALDAGSTVASAASLCGEPEPPATARYPYAAL